MTAPTLTTATNSATAVRTFVPATATAVATPPSVQAATTPLAATEPDSQSAPDAQPATEPAPVVPSPVASIAPSDTPVDPASEQTGTTPPAATPTPVPLATLPPAPVGKTYTMGDAQRILAGAALTPGDLGAGWITSGDATYDNAAAAGGDGTTASLFARCGRLSGRIVELRPPDVGAAFLAYAPVSFFTQLAVYATAAGAADCTNDLRQRYLESGLLATAFGVFDNPAAVAVAQANVPPIGDESFSATLTGSVSVYIGQTKYPVQITILAVMFRTGGLRGTIGIARGKFAPGSGIEQLTPLLNIFLRRIVQVQ